MTISPAVLAPSEPLPPQGFRLFPYEDFLAVLANVNALVGLSNGSTTPVLLAANGAVSFSSNGLFIITKAGVAALTLAAPTTAQNGIRLTFASTTAFAHTITATGLLQTGSASVNVATFAAFAGAGLTLLAYNGKWIVTASTAITFS